ncbi:MAG: extracellular solute-binding protein [Kiritimatiellae bacterium]|nr:extracellular solute-binding protein [Kiritimatiellia bacterium]
MKNRIFAFAAFFGLMFLGAWAEEPMLIPPEGWEPQPSPLASEWAEPGGRYRAFASQYPRSFNYYLDQNVFSAQLFGHQFETLITRNPITLDPEPALAERVEVSEDKTTFTVYLDPRAKWSDGKPITADDVIWTFNAIMDDANLTGPHKVGLANFEPPEKIDERTVRFVSTEVHWRNLWSVGGFNILPKHWWEKQEDFNRVNFEFPVVSGPYKITRLNEPQSVLLSRREDYWAKDDPRLEGLMNFDEIQYRFYTERDVALDNFLRGEFDIHAVYTARFWVERATGERFDNNWIVKQRVFNYRPQGFQGFAMNLRRPLFEDVRVRKALAHLLDRERMNATLMYNQYALTRSYFEDLYPEGNPHELIAFDISKARALLAEAGWEVDDQGRLRKDGRRFVINFLTRDGTAERFLLIYREALSQVGIELNINRKDWSAWSADMRDFNFDMTWAAWGAGVFKDPEGMWHGKHAGTPNSSNVTGFQNEEVDRLIESIATEFDVEKRHEVVRKIDAILVDQVPYVLLWNSDHTRLLYWNKFGTPEHVLGKYGDERGSESYWWIDLDLEEDLRDAREQGLKMPGRPYQINFNEVFTPVPTAVEPQN